VGGCGAEGWAGDGCQREGGVSRRGLGRKLRDCRHVTAWSGDTIGRWYALVKEISLTKSKLLVFYLLSVMLCQKPKTMLKITNYPRLGETPSLCLLNERNAMYHLSISSNVRNTDIHFKFIFLLLECWLEP